NNLHRLDREPLQAALRDGDPIIRKNALRVLAERDNSSVIAQGENTKRLINDPDPRTQLNAFITLGTFKQSAVTADAVVAAWPTLNDRYIQSGAVGCAANDPLLFEEAAFRAAEPAPVAGLIRHVTRLLANRQEPDLTASLIALIGAQAARGDELKQVALETL